MAQSLVPVSCALPTLGMTCLAGQAKRGRTEAHSQESRVCFGNNLHMTLGVGTSGIPKRRRIGGHNPPPALAGGDPLPLWLCWLVVTAFAALGMWQAYSAFRRSIR